jgi:Arc/MetJ-type ribon-helix-helix transcriptional regulator
MTGAGTRGRGRPAVGPTIHARLPEQLVAWLDEKAAATGRKRAEYVRDLLDALRREDADPTIPAELARHTRRFLTGETDKWEFYAATRRFPAPAVADAIGVPVEIVRTRRRDLRHMESTQAWLETGR